MATWEDGPEYAPIERPDAFAHPAKTTVGLEAPPRPPSVPPAPVDRPLFDDPARPVPPLADLIPPPPDQRNPSEPFDVAASVMTSETSAWAAAHWSRSQQPGPGGAPDPYAARAPSAFQSTASATPIPPTPAPQPHPAQPYPSQAQPYPSQAQPYPGQPHPSQAEPSQLYPTLPQNGQSSPGYGSPSASANGHQPAPPAFPPPSGAPTYPPPAPQPGSQPFPPPAYPPSTGPFPAPGTPQWFVPGSGYQQPPPPQRPDPRAVLNAATPGVLVNLAVGCFIWILAPVTLVLAFLLTTRMTHGRKPTRTAFAAVFSFLGLVALISLVTADGSFSAWWDTLAGWACFGSWVMVVTTIVATYRALKIGRPDPPPAPRVTLR